MDPVTLLRKACVGALRGVNPPECQRVAAGRDPSPFAAGRVRGERLRSTAKKGASIMKPRSILAAAAVAAALALTGTACSSSGNASDATKSAAASLATNPAVVKATAKLKANFDNDWTAKHPYASLKTVLKETFPGTSGSDIVTFGLKTFTLGARHPGPARDAWFSGVVLFALNKGATGVHGQPSIPGVTSPATPKTSPSP